MIIVLLLSCNTNLRRDYSDVVAGVVRARLVAADLGLIILDGGDEVFSSYWAREQQREPKAACGRP